MKKLKLIFLATSFLVLQMQIALGNDTEEIIEIIPDNNSEVANLKSQIIKKHQQVYANQDKELYLDLYSFVKKTYENVYNIEDQYDSKEEYDKAYLEMIDQEFADKGKLIDCKYLEGPIIAKVKVETEDSPEEHLFLKSQTNLLCNFTNTGSNLVIISAAKYLEGPRDDLFELDWYLLGTIHISFEQNSFFTTKDFLTDEWVKYWIDNNTGELIKKKVDGALGDKTNDIDHLEPITQSEINNPEFQFPQRIFRDIAPNDPIYNSTKQAHQKNYISGYSDGTFKPDNLVNRAEFAKMLILAFEKPYQESLTQIPTNLQQFPDIENHWYLPFLSKAVDLKLMQGYPDSTIKPDNTIIQAEAIKMAIIALDSTLVTTTEAINTSANWHQPYIDFTLNNLDLSFLTQDSIAEELSRSEAVELIEALLEYEEQSLAISNSASNANFSWSLDKMFPRMNLLSLKTSLRELTMAVSD